MRWGFGIYGSGTWGASSPAFVLLSLHHKTSLEVALAYKIAEKNVLVFTAKISNALGQLIDPTTVTLRLKRPDGTTAPAIAMTKSIVGIYTAELDTQDLAAGRQNFRTLADFSDAVDD